MHRRIWKNIKKGLHIRSPVGKKYRDINPEDIKTINAILDTLI